MQPLECEDVDANVEAIAHDNFDDDPFVNEAFVDNDDFDDSFMRDHPDLPCGLDDWDE